MEYYKAFKIVTNAGYTISPVHHKRYFCIAVFKKLSRRPSALPPGKTLFYNLGEYWLKQVDYDHCFNHKNGRVDDVLARALKNKYIALAVELKSKKNKKAA